MELHQRDLDRIGRRPVLMGITVLALLTTAGDALAHRRARFHPYDAGPAGSRSS